MKKLMMIGAAAAMALGAPVLAQGNSMGKGEANMSASAKANMNADAASKAQANAQVNMKAKVVEKGRNGRASVVEIGGKRYAVCSGSVKDSCINPRQAGLNWGNRPLGYWPGKPASEIDGN